MKLATINVTQTMSSLEIAKLTGKEHKNVLADIRRVLVEAEIEDAKFLAPYKMNSGQTATVYNLPRRECDLVVSGYSVKYRLAIIDRWQELEAQQTPKIPKTYAAALIEAGRLAEIVENQSLTIENQAHRLDEAKKWASVKRMETSYGLTFKFSELKKYSLNHGYAMPKVRDANYAAGVNTYHEDVWMAVYQVDIPE